MERLRLSPRGDVLDDFDYEDAHVEFESELAEYSDEDGDLDLVPIRADAVTVFVPSLSEVVIVETVEADMAIVEEETLPEPAAFISLPIRKPAARAVLPDSVPAEKKTAAPRGKTVQGKAGKAFSGPKAAKKAPAKAPATSNQTRPAAGKPIKVAIKKSAGKKRVASQAPRKPVAKKTASKTAKKPASKAAKKTAPRKR
jgi:hypothetical protein